MRSDKDLAASMRNRQRKTTGDARGWRFRSTSYQCEPRRVAQVLRNYSYFQPAQAKRCKHFGSCLFPHAHHADSHFQPSAVLLESVSWFVSHAPCAWAAENNVQAGLTGGSGYPASVTAGSGRSAPLAGRLWIFWRNAMVRLLHAARGLWTRLRLEAMAREESVK